MGRTKNIKQIIAASIAAFLLVFLASTAYAANETLSVVNVSTPDKPGYVVYWPENRGSAKLERVENGAGFVTLAETDRGYFADFAVKKGVQYVYRVTFGENILSANSSDIQEGKPVISEIKFEAGATSKTEASVIVTFKTDRLAKNQIIYGAGTVYDNQTEQSLDLNQSHTILIEKLKPGTVYHFKIKAFDKTNANSTESEDQTFATAQAPTDQSLLTIIIRALSQAFAGFDKWMKN